MLLRQTMFGTNKDAKLKEGISRQVDLTDVEVVLYVVVVVR